MSHSSHDAYWCDDNDRYCKAVPVWAGQDGHVSMSTEGQPCEPPRLGALEAQVMDVLWTQGPVRIRDVINALPEPLAYTTIATVLSNLQRKCLVEVARDGRSAMYSATSTREQHTASLMTYALRSSPDRRASMLHFVESMDDDDAALLRGFLAADGERVES